MTKTLAASLATACLVAASLGTQSATADDWPQWRGPSRDGVSHETGLLKEWPAAGPPVAWQVEHVGVAYSSLAVVGNRIYTQGDINGVEHIIALDAKDGTLVWAVQPEPLRQALDARVAQELQRADRDGDGVLNEAEALARLGWNFNQFDLEQQDVNTEQLAARRAEALVAALDKNGDKQLSYEEAGGQFRDVFANIDSTDEGADAAAITRSRAAAILSACDRDQDGRLSQREAGQSYLGRRFGQIDRKPEGEKKGDEQLTAAELEAYLTKFEPGHDGLLSAAELAAYDARNFAGKDGVLTAAELRSYYGGYRNGRGDGPRGTPTVDGDRLYVEGGNGDVTCLEAATGKTLWHRNLMSDLGGGRPSWGFSESPLVVGQKLIVTPGGKQGTLAALDKSTGEVLWRSSNTEAAHYSSPMLATIAGVDEVVQFARESMFGVRLDNGQHLWSYSKANNGTANVCTPVIEGDYVFASSSYGTGGGLVRISPSGDGQRADEVYFEKKMANHHGGIVKVGDYMYGFGSGGLLCMNFKTGEIAWANRSVGKGSLVCADGMLYCLGEGHQVALVEATPEEYREHGRFRIEDLGRPSWAHPVVANGRFYIRNQGRLTAYDVAE